MIWVSIDRGSDRPLNRQVYEQIQKHILAGELQAGERLPSTRELAKFLQVSRNVVMEAYDQLYAEGYITGKRGSGSYVAPDACLDQLPPDSQEVKDITISRDAIPEDVIDFRSGLPALDLFPRLTFKRLMMQAIQEAPSSFFGYGNPAGFYGLRAVLAKYLLRTRGVRSHPDQILITSGAAQAFSLLAKLLLQPDTWAVIEDPAIRELQTIFSGGRGIWPVQVDEHGMKTEFLSEIEKPGFIFVTPSHQFPLGGILPIQRRIQLVQYARGAGCRIVEDDYDSEFRYSGPSVSSLHSLAPERVIYAGSFSKTLSPALRLGYLVLPWDLVEAAKSTKRFADLHSPVLEQVVLARFIEQGVMERHIARMKKVYRKRRDTMLASLAHFFGERVKIHGYSTGLHLVAEFPGKQFSEALLEKIANQGVRVYPVEVHAIEKGLHREKIILGYGHLPEEKIKPGVERLKAALDEG